MRPPEVATLAAKGQVTIPMAIREALGLRQGDTLRWDLEAGAVKVSLVAPFDLACLRSLEGTLAEWSSAADEEAFGDL
jgi:AbrB family looped-hinge helix DNA binding protein